MVTLYSLKRKNPFLSGFRAGERTRTADRLITKLGQLQVFA